MTKLFHKLNLTNYISIFHFKSKNIIVLNYKDKTRIINNSKKNYLSLLNQNMFLIGDYSLLILKIKTFLIEIDIEITKKIQLFGLGYKVLEIIKSTKKVLLLKLGFSHFIYCKVPDNFKIFIIKHTKIYMNTKWLTNTMNQLAFLRSFKKPDPYKGKGFRIPNKKLNLKPGKKI